MNVPLVPTDEQGRLRALKSYDILDTIAEEMFDQITRSAAQVCEAPISLLSFVDRDRQWFKSSTGLPLKETPRSASFCTHAIEADDLFTVEDALNDARFRAIPLVTEQEIRFYAGKPLRTHDGHALGTLCVLDRVPRRLTPQQTGTLSKLAGAAMGLLELRRSNRNGLLVGAIDLVSDGVAFAAPFEGECRILFVNKSFSRMTGYAFHEAVGEHLAFPAQNASVLGLKDVPLRDHISAQRPTRAVVVSAKKSGEPMYDRVCTYPYSDENGTALCVVVSHQDITREREAEAQKLQLEAMKTTMASVNHVVRNFVSALQFYRMRISSDRKVAPDALTELDLIMNNALHEINKLSTLDSYKERNTGFGFKVLDV